MRPAWSVVADGPESSCPWSTDETVDVLRRKPVTVPKEILRPGKSGGGEVYADPAHRGRQIPIIPGYPPGSRPDPLTWGPYAEVCQNGVTTKVPLDGNPILGSP